MIDTVALTLSPHHVRFLDMDVFTPSARGLLTPPYYPIRRGGMACHYNPTRKDMERFGYMPRLTLSKRPTQGGFAVFLRVEFSAPKLLYGNNFDELENADFPAVCEKLRQQLAHMKILVPLAALQSAEVSAIHFSKNLPLTDYTSCSMVIREIAKGSVTKQLDGTKTDYRNDGSSIRFHASRHEVIVYDKLKDLERGKVSDKRAFEPHNFMQLNLLDFTLPKQFEVLRIEARIGNRQKLRQLLDKLGCTGPLTFQALFSAAISQTILKDYWRLIMPDMPILAASGFASDELYNAIQKSDPTTKPAKILQMVGALAVTHRVGMGGLRALMEGRGTARTWQRMKQDLGQLALLSKMRFSTLQVAERHLAEFKPLKLAEWKKQS